MSHFPPGFQIIYKGQIYEPAKLVAHQTRDGRATTLIQWNTSCPACAREIAIQTTMAFKEPSRRCSDCKAPGKQVRKIEGAR